MLYIRAQFKPSILTHNQSRYTNTLKLTVKFVTYYESP